MKNIDGKLFKEMVVTGAIVLHNNHPEIDALNVFQCLMGILEQICH